MSYQVLARKWRPQRFDDVVGQQAVTRTLRNALTSGRIAQAFVFAGSRGCGKTTTARILARALNCVNGPTPDPCGECDACVEIAQGRDIDVLEIDAASHTGIDNIREVVIAGLAIAPVRDRYKVFIIDEVHQLSAASFNALLKSIEEPPPHVVFMMATTELHKIPDTILSRSQVFEFRSISAKAITEQLRRIADAESIEVVDGALALVARSAEGSMRDAQSALDQVIAFAGTTISVDDVSAVLGLIGRDLLFDIVEAVLDEDGPRAFALADRAVESGHDLRLVCRELAGLVRDVMIVSVDPARANEGEIAESERARVVELAKRFSREDLMRAFDVLAKAEQDIRNASQPRYHLEMALLRWMHLRKLVPLTDLLDQMGGGASRPSIGGAGRVTSPARSAAPVSSARPAPAGAGKTAAPPSRPAASASAGRPAASTARQTERSVEADVKSASAGSAPGSASAGSFKDALLAEIRTSRGFLYNTVIAQAQKIEVAEDRVTFTFLPAHRALREQLESQRAWLETAAERLSGRKVSVVAVQGGPGADSGDAGPAVPDPRSAGTIARGDGDVANTPGAGAGATPDARREALASPAVRDLLDVFPAEIRNVEEM
jgi:DNA polymerase-3 subunit gamma/tau